MSWNPNAFASIVQAQPLLTFGRPVHLKDSSLNYDPVVLLMPFRLHLTMDALPCPITTGPSEALPPLLDIDPGSRVEWDFNPPETCAARHTLWLRLTSARSRQGLLLDALCVLGCLLPCSLAWESSTPYAPRLVPPVA